MKSRSIPAFLRGPALTWILTGGVALLSGMAAGNVRAAEAGDFVVRAGAAGVYFDSSAAMAVGGAPVPTANLVLSDSWTAAAEFDYHLSPSVSLSLTVGLPPQTDATGLGALAPAGRLGSVRYGTGVVLAKYHFGQLGPVQPWLGAGATRMIIFDTKGGSIPDLDVDDKWGGALQGGAEVMLNDRFGLYGSVSKLFLETDGRGTFMGAPVTAAITLDPTIYQAGLSYRF